MKKNILIVGLVLAAAGVVLWLYAEDATSNWDVWYSTPMLFEYEGPSAWDNLDIHEGMHAYYAFDLKKGARVEFSFTANNTVDFGVMDRWSYEQWKAGEEDYYLLHKQLNISSAQFTFAAPKTDKFYFVIISAGEYPLRVSERHTFSYIGSPIAFAGVGLTAVGAVVALRGFRLKPKVPILIPPGLLDLVKTRGRVKIDELARELGTTEAQIEMGVYELMRAGHPIRFEAETREVVYG